MAGFNSFRAAYKAYLDKGYKTYNMRVGKIHRHTRFMCHRKKLDFVVIDPAGRVVECHALSLSDWEWPRFGVRDTQARHLICSMLTDHTMQYLKDKEE